VSLERLAVLLDEGLQRHGGRPPIVSIRSFVSAKTPALWSVASSRMCCWRNESSTRPPFGNLGWIGRWLARWGFESDWTLVVLSTGTSLVRANYALTVTLLAGLSRNPPLPSRSRTDCLPGRNGRP